MDRIQTREVDAVRVPEVDADSFLITVRPVAAHVAHCIGPAVMVDLAMVKVFPLALVPFDLHKLCSSGYCQDLQIACLYSTCTSLDAL